MTPDDYLEKLLDAVEKNNYWDVEAYAQQVLNKLHHVQPQFRDSLKNYLEQLIKESQAQYQKEKEKQSLIDQILNQKK
jgi:adenosyl cobinamide kinase/adenosyl cobinamide phosphate guanylyltransferase